MFGGHGIYHDGLMFGLVADDELYLKTDKDNLAIFEQQGSTPFEFNAKGKMVKMSYYRAPEEIYDDPTEALKWANLAYEAALRGRKKKK
jgi:DNA transformation protein